MTEIKLSLNSASISTKNKARKGNLCHVLPCHITPFGPTNTAAKYFHVKETETPKSAEKDSTLTTTLTSEPNSKSKEEIEGLAQKEDTLVANDKKEKKVYETYFRGRKLKGIEVSLPEDLVGVVLQETETKTVVEAPKKRLREDDFDDDFNEDYDLDDTLANNIDITKKVKVWEQLEPKLAFEKIMVWDHEKVPNAETNQYITGVTDWVKLAHAIHDPL